MRASFMYGPKDIRFEERDIPKINAHEILLQVKSAAICGTDIRMINNGYPGITEETPLVLGHEIAGIISQVGEQVTGYKPGMRVAVAPNMGCGICDHCVSGGTHLCPDYKALGIHIDGGFAEYVRIPESAVRQGNVIELEDHVSFDEAALNEPFSCTYNGLVKCDIKPGDTVMIMGTGPIGLMHAKLAKMAGAAKVLLNDISSQRLDICKRFDPSFLIIESEGMKEKVRELTGGRGLDVCITANPSPQAQMDAVEMMGFGGRVNFFGGLPQAAQPVSIDTNQVHYRQLILTGSARSSLFQYRKTLQFIASGLVTIQDLISERFSLEQLPEAVRRASQAEGLKNIIIFE